MPYFADLTPHTETDPPPGGGLNVGWLSREHDFPKGEVPAAFVAVLEDLCRRPVHLHRGYHVCEFCVVGDDRQALTAAWINATPEIMLRGNGQIRVTDAAGTHFVAPTMVHHYVTAHGYHPPAAFIAAVLGDQGAPRFTRLDGRAPALP